MDFGGPIGYRLMLKYPDRVAIDGPLWATELASGRTGRRRIGTRSGPS
jgi:hypothetical protein